MKVIGISGKAESGKDTAAGFIIEVFERPRRTAFADDLKLQALEAWDTERHPYAHLLPLLDDDGKLRVADNLKQGNAAFRSFLQDFGQGKRREDPEYWVRRAFARHEARHHGRPMVIPDVRYVNEADEVLARRGILLRIERPSHQNRLTEAQRLHPSECDLDDYEKFTAILVNNGDPVAFLGQVLRAVRPYMNLPLRVTGGV